jgi:hypothetical protein
LIVQDRRIWVLPRSRFQSRHAATHLGALEMGGLFCLPNADSLRGYLPGALREEVRSATLADEPETKARFEAVACDLACSLR